MIPKKRRCNKITNDPAVRTNSLDMGPKDDSVFCGLLAFYIAVFVQHSIQPHFFIRWLTFFIIFTVFCVRCLITGKCAHLNKCQWGNLPPRCTPNLHLVLLLCMPSWRYPTMQSKQGRWHNGVREALPGWVCFVLLYNNAKQFLCGFLAVMQVLGFHPMIQLHVEQKVVLSLNADKICECKGHFCQ